MTQFEVSNPFEEKVLPSRRLQREQRPSKHKGGRTRPVSNRMKKRLIRDQLQESIRVSLDKKALQEAVNG